MVKIILKILYVVWCILKIPVYIILFFAFLFLGFVIFYITIGVKSGRRFPKNSGKRYKKPNLLKRLFIYAPKQFVDDLFNRKPDFFKPQGLIVFCGRQGRGKTISLVEYISRLQLMYPKCKVLSNFAYDQEDNSLKHWKQLTDFKNSHLGVVVGIDELQNWFSSKQSKNFPPEMLAVVTQNRKNRRVILGTAQNFYMIAKDIRSQCTEVRDCLTLLGCITIVRRSEPIVDCDGNVEKFKRLGMYMYVHNKELRDSYDTYKVIESLSASGFVERSITNNNISVTNEIDKKVLKR